jgi:hypothetical protein
LRWLLPPRLPLLPLVPWPADPVPPEAAGGAPDVFWDEGVMPLPKS